MLEGKLFICENCLGKIKANKEPTKIAFYEGAMPLKRYKVEVSVCKQSTIQLGDTGLESLPHCYFCLPAAERWHQADILQARDSSASFSSRALISRVIMASFQRLSAV